jgi:hypothetical protein
MTLNDRLDKFHRKLIKASIDHRRLAKELPTDKQYHDGKSHLGESLSVEFRLMFKDELGKVSNNS